MNIDGNKILMNLCALNHGFGKWCYWMCAGCPKKCYFPRDIPITKGTFSGTPCRSRNIGPHSYFNFILHWWVSILALICVNRLVEARESPKSWFHLFFHYNLPVVETISKRDIRFQVHDDGEIEQDEAHHQMLVNC